jgi:cysteine desulfurase / selenocysteine lyase
MTSHIQLGNRSLFPKLTHKIYLNHAAISPISILVEQAIQQTVLDYAQKGLDAFPIYLEQRIRLRQKVSRLLQCKEQEIAFVSNTSTGIIQIAQNFNWTDQDSLLLLQGEFPTNVTPWLQVARQYELNIEWMNADDFRSPTKAFQKLEDILKTGLRMMSISAVQFQTGLRLPVEQIGELCHQYDCLLFVDGIQCVGATPIDLTHVDFLSAGGHKWLMGIEGTGILYASENVHQHLSPNTAGWLSHENGLQFLFEGAGHLRYDRPIIKNIHFVEAGVYNAIGLVALEQSIDILQKIGVENICTHINSYFDQIESQLLNWGFDSQRCNTGKSTILSLKPPSHIDSPQLPEILKNKGISCSYPDGFLRLAPHWCNPIEETQQLLQIIEDLV